jgi:hypothetical protein
MNRRRVSSDRLTHFAAEGVPFALGLVLAWTVSGDEIINAAAETMFVMIALLVTAGSLMRAGENDAEF